MNKKITALILFSGGLDSIIAAKILQVQGIEVDGVCFESNFFNCEKAKKAAQELNIKLKIINISKEVLEFVKNPPSGYGKNLNPCIDCHALMVKKAGEYLTPQPSLLIRREGGAERQWRGDILATGEVLGQRPFSQNKDALARIEKIAGIEILRPLSAKKLPETVYEKQGLVNRGRLKNISGRSRDNQMELAKGYGLKDYSSSAGGCLLTDPEFSQRLGKMVDYWPNCDINAVNLLKYGRVFWMKKQISANLERINTNHEWILAIIGRHKKDNEQLEKLARKGDVMVELKDIAGPLTIVRITKKQDTITKQIPNSKFQIPNILEINIPEKLKMSELKFGEEKSFEEILQIAGLLTGHYAVKARGKHVKLEVRSKK